MIQQLKAIIERVKTWPEWRREDAAYLLDVMEESGTRIYRLSDEERDAVREGLGAPSFLMKSSRLIEAANRTCGTVKRSGG
jgi:hypothetical protein